MLKNSIIILCFMFCKDALATGPYEATVEQIQVVSIGSPFTAVYLDLDITDSPCSTTNSLDRFTLSNDAQYSMALTAYTSGQTLKINGTGACVSNVEQINNMIIKP